MPKEVAYKDYFVAYLDILGFKKHVADKSAKEIHKMFSGIKKAEEIIKGKIYKKSSYKEIEKNTFFLYFSDSIICAIPCTIPNSFEYLASHCMLIQHSLWMQPNPVWLRGAITKGKLYCNENEVFGPALVEAYQLEGLLARYPRIIMTRCTYEQGIENLETQEDVGYIFDTADGLMMIESLKYFRYPELKNLRKQIENSVKYEKDVKVREKYLWIREHFNSFVDVNSNLKPFRTAIV